MVDQLNKFERQSQGRLEEMTKQLISTFIKSYALKKSSLIFTFFLPDLYILVPETL